MGYNLPEDHHGPTPGDLKRKLEEAGSASEAAETMRRADAEEDRRVKNDPVVPANDTTAPAVVYLDEAEQRELQRLHDQQIAAQQFIATVQQQGEERLAQLQKTGRDIWQKLEAKYGLDLKRVDFALSDDGTKLLPVRMKLGA